MEDTGLLTAYVALGLGAVVPIYFGAMGALKYEKTTGKRRAGSKSRKGVPTTVASTARQLLLLAVASSTAIIILTHRIRLIIIIIIATGL